MRIVPLNFAGKSETRSGSCGVAGFCSVLEGRHPTKDESYKKLFGEKIGCCGACRTGRACTARCTCNGNQRHGCAHDVVGVSRGHIGLTKDGDRLVRSRQKYERGVETRPTSGQRQRKRKTDSSRSRDKASPKFTVGGIEFTRDVSMIGVGHTPAEVGNRSKRPTIEIQGRSSCNPTLILHLFLDVAAAKKNGCSTKDIQEAMDQLEEAVRKKWTKKRCPCDSESTDSLTDAQRKRLKGCTFSVKLAWHNKEGKRVAKKKSPDKRRTAVTVLLNCNNAQGGEATATQDQELKKNHRKRQGSDIEVWAHEIGHLMFGGGSTDPGRRDRKDDKKPYVDEKIRDLFRDMGWGDATDGDMAHSKRKQFVKGEPIDDRLMNAGPALVGDELSHDEICAMKKLYNMCPDASCCPKVGIGGSRIPRGRIGFILQEPVWIGSAITYKSSTVETDVFSPDNFAYLGRGNESHSDVIRNRHAYSRS